MSEHLTLDELLSVRDEEAPPTAVRHAETCGECGAELTRLRDVRAALASLPEARPVRDGWPRLRDELERRSRGRRRWRRFAAAAAAAALAVAVGLTALVHRQRRAAERELAGLVARSQRLEQVWRTARPDGRVLSAPQAARLAVLEQGIARLDAELAGLPRSSRRGRDAVRLWQARVALLDAMTGESPVRTAYVGF